MIEMEAGETRWSAFLARNIGLNTWQSTGSVKVHLGTDEPRDRKSPMFNPGPGDGAWISVNRPTGLAKAPVGPGGTGIFRFRVLAPTTPKDYKEYFEPVADGPGGGWMGAMISQGCYPDRWCAAHLIYRVRAQVPPQVSFSDLPARIAAGAALDLTTSASDNVGLDRVVVSVDGDSSGAQADDPPQPDVNAFDTTRFGVVAELFKSRESRFSFSRDCRWSLGEHTVKVLAYDLLGQVDQVTRSFTVLSDRDCDGVDDGGDACPDEATRSSSDPDGCPPPHGVAARSTVFSAAPGTGSKQDKNKIKHAIVRGVLGGATVVAFCRPSCGQPTELDIRRDRHAVRLKRLEGKVVEDGTRVVFRVTLPRSRNVFGRQWTWLAKNGPKGPRRQCLRPGSRQPLGCD
ncbi:MAG TPA: hypothetical protein VF729_03935 [Solirubrobacterales bacterium]